MSLQINTLVVFPKRDKRCVLDPMMCAIRAFIFSISINFLFCNCTNHKHPQCYRDAEMYLIVKVEPAQISRFCCSSVTMCKCPLAKHKIPGQVIINPSQKLANTDHLWHSPNTTQKLTKLSSLLATIDANLCSPASSDIKKTYSGAVTWFDLCVLPVTTCVQFNR